ncbi:unnamed protein product [marine sediment metagenome]|uniref:Uncharacterized protein n=1 Tax=marine sediment metagenome TaxID=412755 RepID=X0SDA6_9ZZZZ
MFSKEIKIGEAVTIGEEDIHSAHTALGNVQVTGPRLKQSWSHGRSLA